MCENHRATLVAVSKNQPLIKLKTLYEWGQRDFGENRVQALCERQPSMPQDTRWHMIGHLQRNKVRHIVPFVHLVHSVDSWRLADTLHKESQKVGRVVDCLLQVKIAQEETKYGWSVEELKPRLSDASAWEERQNIRILGLMGMASQTSDSTQIKAEFSCLRHLFQELKQMPNLSQNVRMEVLSMGMSHDYDIALSCGSNMLRVGRHLFEDASPGALGECL